ncbi:hypothetical protein [Spiroplasma endosymbiont of Glossina fuscipes fuscipes]|uniref:hypothetical protein n=1 Tax=Spiroplasma endosymbiont of Glossina fuscipes fuscipes TaxID=2004463 RepID=UPI003CECC11D
MSRYWKSGIWQIEISQELLAKYIDNYFKNIKIDNKSVIYNSNNELSVPFDNYTIYNENGVWKTKQGGQIPSDVIKDSDLNKDYIDKVNNKYIVKTSQDINTKQDKLVSGTNIKTINGNSLLGNGDISISGGNDWEVVDISDFIPDGSQCFIKDFNKTKYQYKLWAIYKYQQNITLTTAIETPINYNGAIEWTRYIPTLDNNLIVRINTEYGNISFGNFGKDIIQNIIWIGYNNLDHIYVDCKK